MYIRKIIPTIFCYGAGYATCLHDDFFPMLPMVSMTLIDKLHCGTNQIKEIFNGNVGAKEMK